MTPKTSEREIATTRPQGRPSPWEIGLVHQRINDFLGNPAARRDASELFACLTNDYPVLDLGTTWLISGVEEIVALSGSPHVSSLPTVDGTVVPLTQCPSLATAFAMMLPTRDGVDHRRLRALVARGFSPGRIHAVRASINGCVDGIFAEAEARGAMDIVADLAIPLPVALSCAIFQIPPSDSRIVLEWAELVSGQILCFNQSPDELRSVEARVAEFKSYIESLCAHRLIHPGDDLISDLAAACHAGALSSAELQAMVLMLLINGLETFTASLSTAIWESLDRPEMLEGVAGNTSLAEAVFEECVRLHTPVRFSARTLTADTELGGMCLGKGDTATLFYAAANRDARRFSDPDLFDPQRRGSRHVGFGVGPHFCLGAALSISAGGIVLDRIARYGNRLTTEATSQTVEWSESHLYNALKRLPVKLNLGKDDPRGSD